MVDAVIACLLAPKSRLILAEWPENKQNERDKEWENWNGQWRCAAVGIAGGGVLRGRLGPDDGTWEVAFCHSLLLHTSKECFFVLFIFIEHV